MIFDRHPIKEDEDLIYFDDLAIQKDLTKSIEYGEDYFDKYVGYKGTPIAISINTFRTKITEKYCKNSLLDIGIGSGEFINSSKLKVYGFDINPLGVEWLKSNNIYIDPYNDVLPMDLDGWTFWDSLEHFPEPQDILKLIRLNDYVFISIPIFYDILKVKKSKHWRLNEHYYYFTPSGLIRYMQQSGFRFFEQSDAEIKAGREEVLTFVFQRS